MKRELRVTTWERKKKKPLCYRYLQPLRWILCRETNKSQSSQARLKPNLFNIFYPNPLRNCSVVHSAQSKWIRYSCSPRVNTEIWDWVQEWWRPQKFTRISGLGKTFPSSLPCQSLLIPVCIMPYLSICPKTHSEKKLCKFCEETRNSIFSLWLNKIGICWWSPSNQCKSGVITSKLMEITN